MIPRRTIFARYGDSWCSLLAAVCTIVPFNAAWCSAAERSNQTQRAQRSKKPNVLFILADDLGWRDLGCYGSSFYETPQLDRLANRGMRFTSAYASCPVCSPTRASILTGKYPARLGITDWIHEGRNNQPEKWKKPTALRPAPYVDRLALEESTLAETFKKAGYATFFAGKWHLGPEGFWPEDHGFDVNIGGTGDGRPKAGGKYFSPYGNQRLADGPVGEYLPDRLAHETAGFLESAKNQPFFIYLSFYLVHTPLMAPDPIIQKYEKKQAQGPPEDWGREGHRKVRRVQNHAVYGAMVESLDRAIGAVVAKLEALGLADDTVIVFMSDNGGLSTAEGSPTSNLPLRGGKGWLYEGGIREPMFVIWPGVTKSGSVCDTPVTSTDFYPTLLEIAGLPAKPQQHVDGKSMVPLLKQLPMSRGPLYWHYPHYANQADEPGGAIRDGDWKLIENYDHHRIELYNLADDIGETRNLASTKPAKVNELRKKLSAWRHKVGARMPTRNPKFNTAMDKRAWKVVSCTSEETLRADNGAYRAIDGDPRTQWHTVWDSNAADLPHEIVIDMGEVLTLSGFSYLPRQDKERNGIVTRYAFYMSKDGQSWGMPVAKGRFKKSLTRKAERRIKFEQAVTGRFLRFVARESINGRPYTAAAEIGVYAGEIAN